jgi:hypothetical protein
MKGHSYVIAAGISLVAGQQDLTEVCASHEITENHGCDSYCGYSAVKAGNDFICLPEGSKAPYPLDASDLDEYCDLVAGNGGCNDLCGYHWNADAGGCSSNAPAQPAKKVNEDDAPIIGGSGKYRFQYMPDLLKAPDGATLVNCHGLVTDKDKNIYLTYQNDAKTDANCLIRWKPDGTSPEFMTGGNSTLCSGTPHGLKITTEGDTQYLYHANNNQKLTKTTLDGTIVWQVNGPFGQSTTQYRPTWFATPPDSKYTYLCDGYGSNNVYAFDRTNGVFMNKTWGGHSPGKGPDQPHGTFSTNHGCTYDSRLDHTIVVSDRANSRLEFFEYDPDTPNTFEYANHTVNLQPAMGTGTLPCNLRMYPEQDGIGIIPDLAGPVAVVDKSNTVVSVVNVSVLLAAEQHNHPHDAIFLPNGDIVVATWNPGRISYWKRLPAE